MPTDKSTITIGIILIVIVLVAGGLIQKSYNIFAVYPADCFDTNIGTITYTGAMSSSTESLRPLMNNWIIINGKAYLNRGIQDTVSSSADICYSNYAYNGVFLRESGNYYICQDYTGKLKVTVKGTDYKKAAIFPQTTTTIPSTICSATVCTTGQESCSGTDSLICQNNQFVNQGKINGKCGYSVPCTDTCSSKGFTCGSQMICGVPTNCGYCNSGYTCQISSCVANTVQTCTNGQETCNGQINNICTNNQWVSQGQVVGKCGYTTTGTGTGTGTTGNVVTCSNNQMNIFNSCINNSTIYIVLAVFGGIVLLLLLKKK